MENLIFCLNATIPIFALMLLGSFFKKVNILHEHSIKDINSFVFKVSLPALLFQDLSTEDFFSVWDTKYVLFCFFATVLSICIAVCVSFLVNDKDVQGEFSQAAYRSSAALLGIGFIQNIYGNSGMAPLMIIGTVPLYNVMAVVLLSFLKPGQHKMDKKLIKSTLIGIITNPIILGIIVGLLWSVLRIPQPVMLSKTIKYLAATTTPMGLIALGASIDIHQATAKLKPAVTASFLKLILFCSLFLPVAISMGYRQDKLIALLVMLGSPTTVSCFIMAKNMGHEGTVSSTTIMITTLFSAFTLTGWLYLLRVLGYV